MSSSGSSGAAAKPAAPDGAVVSVRVWDWPVRAFHWAVVGLAAASLVSVRIGGDAMDWHLRAGYALLALVLFRILWGFAGSRHARFASFVTGPRAVLAYLTAIRRRSKPVYAGHNPLGGWSVVALLLMLLLQGASGLFANNDVAVEGPLAKLVSKDLSDAISSLHRRSAWLFWGLACIHVAAVLYYLFALRENLIRPMINGRKTLPRRFADAGFAAGAGVGGRALALLALAACAVWWLVTRL